MVNASHVPFHDDIRPRSSIRWLYGAYLPAPKVHGDLLFLHTNELLRRTYLLICLVARPGLPSHYCLGPLDT